MVDYSARIIEDSVNPVGDRLTTFELTYPRFVHAELMTHRMFSRNSASSRAIPCKKLMSQVERHPIVPKWWGRAERGMQAREEIDNKSKALRVWLGARDSALDFAWQLESLGLHKQIVNRVLEPWMFITVIVTATEFDNWFHLRDSEQAQPEIAWVAREMRSLYEVHEPRALAVGQWHLPFVDLEDRDSELFIGRRDLSEELFGAFLRKISVARCARVSYLTHDGRRDLDEDVRLHDRLAENGHWSPFEHVAQCCGSSVRSGNFVGWAQYRKQFRREHHGRRLP